ncbi:MAG: hypothetical protein E6Q76_13920 [Rhizobium sp.]|nr:MAG: hypothetical protein E6Q76_13920 [Rhizobium sp.]
MARVRFTADFDYKPLPSTTIAYRAGMVCVVKRECADQAIAAGKAVDFFRSKEAADGKTEIGR